MKQTRMGEKIVILGGGGFAREAALHILDSIPHAQVVFVDENPKSASIQIARRTFAVVSDWQMPVGFEHFVVGVGSPAIKRKLVSKALEVGLRPAQTVIHPSATVQDAAIGLGGIVAPGCRLTTNVRIGAYVIVNLNVTIGHDAVVGDYCTINPGASVSGNDVLGDDVVLGTGTVVREGVHIAANVTVGAQAAVVKDEPRNSVLLVGVPASSKPGKGE